MGDLLKSAHEEGSRHLAKEGFSTAAKIIFRETVFLSSTCIFNQFWSLGKWQFMKCRLRLKNAW
jgi:hypothetical protein